MVDGSEYRFISGSKKIRSTRIGIDSVLDSRSVCSLLPTTCLCGLLTTECADSGEWALISTMDQVGTVVHSKNFNAYMFWKLWHGPSVRVAWHSIVTFTDCMITDGCWHCGCKEALRCSALWAAKLSHAGWQVLVPVYCGDWRPHCLAGALSHAYGNIMSAHTHTLSISFVVHCGKGSCTVMSLLDILEI